MAIKMIKREEFKSEIESLRKDINSLDDLIQTLVKNVEKSNYIINKTNNLLIDFFSKKKNPKEIQKNISKKRKEKKENEKYDWIEDTIDFN